MMWHFLSRPGQIFNILFTLAALSHATPLSIAEQGAVAHEELFARANCANPCGWSGQLCCGSGQACYTDIYNKAQCSSTAGGAGQWLVYTTTLLQTDLATVTRVASTYIPVAGGAGAAGAAATARPGAPKCDYAVNESLCGSICCGGQQYCVKANQCAPAAGGRSGTVASPARTTAAFGAPVRASTGAAGSTRRGGAATSTEPFTAPVATGAAAGSGSNGNGLALSQQQKPSSGLSGGAIAGIVIGVLVALALLLLLCFCCIARGLFHLICGDGKKNKRKSTYEKRSTYYDGQGPGRVSRDSKLPGWLVGLLAALGLNKVRKDAANRRRAYEDYDGMSQTDYASSLTTPTQYPDNACKLVRLISKCRF